MENLYVLSIINRLEKKGRANWTEDDKIDYEECQKILQTLSK